MININSEILRAFHVERSGRRGDALDIMWDSLGHACNEYGLPTIDNALLVVREEIESGDCEPEPFTLLGVFMITMPIAQWLDHRPALHALTMELFGEWEWDTEELENMK